MISVGELVFVRGKSSKGKSRTAERGSVWKVLKIWGTRKLLEPMDGSGECRWVDGEDDVDFEILRVLDPNNP
jgi:hypothetical protein